MLQILFLNCSILRHIIKECYLIEVVLRGSLSIGAFFKSHKFVIGPAVDDAAECYDKADIIGIVASPYFHSVLENAVTQSGKSVFPFIKSQITSKGKYYNMWALNWNSDKNTKIIRSLKNNFNLFSNTNVSLKYENTLKLFNG